LRRPRESVVCDRGDDTAHHRFRFTPFGEPDVSASSSVRVCVLSAVRFYREGLSQLLGADDAIDVIDVAATDVASIDRALAMTPDVVLIDISTHDGLDAMHRCAERMRGVNVVAVAVSEKDADINECARAGVAGYVTRDATLRELIDVVISAAHGELRCSAPIASVLRRSLARHAPLEGDLRLTAREVEILTLMGEDLSNKEIARRLTIELSTVKSHVHNILEKLRVERRADAVTRVVGPRWYGSERPGRVP
jgi:two-component system, NarL family, nitrate/nitrite response regulator NarL